MSAPEPAAAPAPTLFVTQIVPLIRSSATSSAPVTQRELLRQRVCLPFKVYEGYKIAFTVGELGARNTVRICEEVTAERLQGATRVGGLQDPGACLLQIPVLVPEAVSASWKDCERVPRSVEALQFPRPEKSSSWTPPGLIEKLQRVSFDRMVEQQRAGTGAKPRPVPAPFAPQLDRPGHWLDTPSDAQLMLVAELADYVPTDAEMSSPALLREKLRTQAVRSRIHHTPVHRPDWEHPQLSIKRQERIALFLYQDESFGVPQFVPPPLLTCGVPVEELRVVAKLLAYGSRTSVVKKRSLPMFIASCVNGEFFCLHGQPPKPRPVGDELKRLISTLNPRLYRNAVWPANPVGVPSWFRVPNSPDATLREPEVADAEIPEYLRPPRPASSPASSPVRERASATWRDGIRAPNCAAARKRRIDAMLGAARDAAALSSSGGNDDVPKVTAEVCRCEWHLRNDLERDPRFGGVLD